MKKPPRFRRHFSLGAKLVLSYLVVTLAVNNYFYWSQISQLQGNAESAAQILAQDYKQNNYSWENMPVPNFLQGYSEIMDVHGVPYMPSYPYVSPIPYNDAKTFFKQALQQALQG